MRKKMKRKEGKKCVTRFRKNDLTPEAKHRNDVHRAVCSVQHATLTNGVAINPEDITISK